jgi:ribosomally synthesized peptide (two-chain TOMM family)
MSTVKIQSGEPMLEFRLAYLRAVARAWQDSAYRDQLLGLQDIQPTLVKDFSLTTVWPRLNIALYRSDDTSQQALWKPDLTAGWIGPDDIFQIVLPEKPSRNATEALARYYQVFPDFMGPVGTVDGGFTPPPVGMVGAALPTGLGIPGGGPDSMLAFGGVVLRAIALAWESHAFKSQLLDPTLSTAAPVLSQWLGYNNPFNFAIRFVANPAFTWNADAGEWNMTNPDGSAIKNGIVLNYPNAPAEGPLWPIALTSYNNTGSAYPFTC